MGRTELRTEIEIRAPAAHVYRILTDFPRYSEWNPFITSVSGRAAVGEQLEVALSLPEGKDYRFKPRLVSVRANGELRWQGRFLVPGLLDAEHFFQVNEQGPHVSRFVHGEDFSGLLLRFMTQTLTLTARGFVYMNEALKKRAESTL